MSAALIDAIAREIDQPVIEPTLSIQGVEVMVRPGQVGRYVDKTATLALLAHQVEKMQDGVIPLVIREERPVIEDVSGQAELARHIKPAADHYDAGRSEWRPWSRGSLSPTS
jgi:vancomycin resistance protein YoaR